MTMFNLEEFINQYVVKRDGSMFSHDVAAHSLELCSVINGKSVLVIGGAGSIGSRDSGRGYKRECNC